MIETIYFTAPAWLSNTLTAIFYYALMDKNHIIPSWPVDFGATIRGRRLFGNNKTFFGCIFTILISALIGSLQGRSIIGWTMGIATVIGTLINSFAKRRLNITPGGTLFPFDQLDYAIMNTMVLYLFEATPPSFNIFYFLGFALIYQLSINALAFKFGFIKRFLWWRNDRV
ncbi:CDP-archaeol synthase [Candidatus Jorgensenbacteria bacterium]|nr:CDP-archaeol synthase [Candidatus Jorgensenbacteria bacterium]